MDNHVGARLCASPRQGTPDMHCAARDEDGRVAKLQIPRLSSLLLVNIVALLIYDKPTRNTPILDYVF